jgi:hypothetical protein
VGTERQRETERERQRERDRERERQERETRERETERERQRVRSLTKMEIIIKHEEQRIMSSRKIILLSTINSTSELHHLIF